MTKDELKNMISFALKDPILQQGFEIICKENAELKASRLKWHKVADGDLPKEEDGWVCNQDGYPSFFEWSTEQWLDCEGTQIRTTEWCYMPHKE